MERSLCTRRQRSQNPLSSSPTVDSLDLQQLLASDCRQPLISESVTFDTLSFSSSFSDQVPPFCTCKLPRLSIVGLGDHLKMFSEPLSQLQEPTTVALSPKIVITSPTSPRLRSMFRECLCISKWAECLTSWQAPGHIPWGDIPYQTTADQKWLPEGSLYSPEDFSRALHLARAGRVPVDAAQTGQEPCAILAEGMDFDSSSGTLTHIELVDMMRELKDLKNFFQGEVVQQPKHPEQLTLPSLMISNSHCTFPLSLDSCQSFTLKPAANLADRRGRKPPPPLLLKNETPLPELPYPGIPTAFLGSPSIYSPKSQDVDLANVSGLPIEDMINNLRLQCSSMTLNTPPPIPGYEPVKKSTEAKFAKSTIGNTSFLASDASSESLGKRLVTIPTGLQKGSSPRGKAVNPHRVGSTTKNLQRTKCTRTDPPGKKAEALSKYSSSPPLLLRSSLAKRPTFRPRSVKSVRFALSPSEFEKDVASLMYDDVWRSSQVSAQNHLYDKAHVKKIPTPHLNSDKESSEERTHLQLLQSRGRHSLSRIIKGPIFSGKENKRATVSNAFSTRWEFNEKCTVLGDSSPSESIQKKSRMPVPLRNILTRFK